MKRQREKKVEQKNIKKYVRDTMPPLEEQGRCSCSHCGISLNSVEEQGLKFADKWYCFRCAQSQINFLVSHGQVNNCYACGGLINETGLKFSDKWYCFGCCQKQIQIIESNCSTPSKIKKCKNCKERKEITCSDCLFKYTQLVCRDCNGEHRPVNIKYKDMDDEKRVAKSELCTVTAPDWSQHEY